MKSEELDVCLWCGGNGEGKIIETHTPRCTLYRVKCTKCKAETREYKEKELAIADWNKGKVW